MAGAVGVIGADAPRQIILASEALPLRLFGSWSPETGALPAGTGEEALELLGAVDAPAVTLLAQLLGGEHDHLAGLILCNDSAATLRLFYVLRMLSAQRRLSVPVHLLDAPASGESAPGTAAARQGFVAAQYARLVGFLESVTDVRADRRRLQEAAEQEERLGRALQQMRARRRQGSCSGTAAVAAYRAAARQPVEQALAVIEAAGAEETGDDGTLPGMWTYLTGSEDPDGSIISLLEERGALVIGEDHDGGDSSWLGEAAYGAEVEEILWALAGNHARRAPRAARASSHSRAQHLGRELHAASAEQTLSLVRLHDEAPLWDAAAQQEQAAQQGVAWAMVSGIRPGQERPAVEQALAEVRGIREASHV